MTFVALRLALASVLASAPTQTSNGSCRETHTATHPLSTVAPCAMCCQASVVETWCCECGFYWQLLPARLSLCQSTRHTALPYPFSGSAACWFSYLLKCRGFCRCEDLYICIKLYSAQTLLFALLYKSYHLLRAVSFLLYIYTWPYFAILCCFEPFSVLEKKLDSLLTLEHIWVVSKLSETHHNDIIAVNYYTLFTLYKWNMGWHDLSAIFYGFMKLNFIQFKSVSDCAIKSRYSRVSRYLYYLWHKKHRLYKFETLWY